MCIMSNLQIITYRYGFGARHGFSPINTHTPLLYHNNFICNCGLLVELVDNCGFAEKQKPHESNSEAFEHRKNIQLIKEKGSPCGAL